MSVESRREFVDTNVLVYAHDTSAGEKRSRAIEVLEQIEERSTGAVSIQVLQEFFVTVTAKVTAPLPPRVAAAIIADIGVWPTHAPELGDVLGAVEIQQRFQLSFWDAMILRSASSLGCAVLWSEDFTAGRTYGGVEVRSPF